MPWAFERTATERGAPRAAAGEARRDPVGALPLRPGRICRTPIEEGGDASTMAGELVRHLVVELISAHDLAPVLAGEGSRSFPLEGQLQDYADSDLVSHTFALRDDDSAVVALILEQKVRRAN